MSRFGLWTRMAPKNQIIQGAHRPDLTREDIFERVNVGIQNAKCEASLLPNYFLHTYFRKKLVLCYQVVY